ncbi:ribosome small subunit-dependent GTPase A [Actinobaculum sp. 352]|uniref:ribosome small subunit-dependent GTPase A n=1 Tax=Actinobaculum sp. 352 TaxID=2490946 RepID=UPI000F7F2AB7|nr:ribosome small subunit-dependent GTPase A [Actinobaculum sp. 352]RTE49005.1 ribosome small subunit-dependent GTPase A [Actinobaculum sp. 352]
MRRDIGTDDPRVHVRPGRRSRPRTKIRPDYSSAPLARVTGVDRGRYRLLVGDGTEVTAVKAREIGRGAIVVGDRVRVDGDVSGRKDSLARIVRVEERSSELRRSPEEGEGRERVVVANADQLAIVTALTQPDPRPGMIDRCLVAAYDAGMTPLLVLTKSDLADPAELQALYEPLGQDIFVLRLRQGSDDEADAADDAKVGVTTADVDDANGQLERLRQALTGHETVLVGHSGVGKSTVINALVPGANRTTGAVNDVTGKGRHTSTSAVSLPLPDGGRLIDTPGVRSFGLAHVKVDDVLRGFTDLVELTSNCPRGCSHDAAAPECALSDAQDVRLRTRVASFRRLLASRGQEEWK